jgi:hypothetical protein
VLALAWCWLGAVAPADAATLAEKARESGCTGKPVTISSGFYKCATSSGAEAFFNVPDGRAPDEPARKSPAPANGKTATPGSFPRVDADTQKGRDELRRKVLSDELAAEEKLLAQARTDYGTGAPPPLPEERADAQKYADRISRLRQSVQLHERNIDALRKELAAVR